INGRTHRVDVDPDTPLLWVLRDTIGLTGTKYGCGIAQCGACTVHVDGIAMRSCSAPLSAVEGRQITTIEGLAQNGVLHKVQQAWLDHDVPQCGYCQCGMIMAVAALLKDKLKPTDADIDSNITNICRCGTYQQVRAAIHAAAPSAGDGEAAMKQGGNIDRRRFVASAAALGGGFALGFELPFGGPSVARAQDATPEINAWVVIRPDESVAIRIARAEMGQGTMTGLAQLVAEELDCDW